MQTIRMTTSTLLVSLLAVACSADRTFAADIAPGWQNESVLFHDGLDRWYRVYVPEDLPKNAPLVLLLHGGGQSMRKIFRSTAGATQHWPITAEREKFLLVVPNAANATTNDPKGDRQNWNDIRDSVPLGNSEEDDVGFLKSLLDHCHETFGTDRSRTYVTGSSNGGMMTFRMLVEAPEYFAAGAAFIATLPDSSPHIKTPTKPTPLMIVNGTEDPLIKWNGGPITIGRGRQRSTPATVTWWIDALNATGEVSDEHALPDKAPDDSTRIHLTKYSAGENGAPLWFYRVEGGGHAAPSAAHPLPDNFMVRRMIGTSSRDVESSDLAWQFLKQFQREEGRSPDRPVQ